MNEVEFISLLSLPVRNESHDKPHVAKGMLGGVEHLDDSDVPVGLRKGEGVKQVHCLRSGRTWRRGTRSHPLLTRSWLRSSE